ncbi:MAG: hypothetical protein ACLUKN_10700 [Bacilli bacterium]
MPDSGKDFKRNGFSPDDARNVVAFTDLIPYYPTRRIIMEATGAGWDNLSMRAVDLLTPIGFGQRALIVAPPLHQNRPHAGNGKVHTLKCAGCPSDDFAC